jgi:hypothetical protein
MSFGDWLRQLVYGRDPDHALTEEERLAREHTSETAFDVRGAEEREYVGTDFDPDEPRSGRL